MSFENKQTSDWHDFVDHRDRELRLFKARQRLLKVKLSLAEKELAHQVSDKVALEKKRLSFEHLIHDQQQELGKARREAVGSSRNVNTNSGNSNYKKHSTNVTILEGTCTLLGVHSGSGAAVARPAVARDRDAAERPFSAEQ